MQLGLVYVKGYHEKIGPKVQTHFDYSSVLSAFSTSDARLETKENLGIGNFDVDQLNNLKIPSCQSEKKKSI